MRNLFLFTFCIAMLTACNKEPGVGGTSTIKGKLYKIETNALGEVLAEYYDADQDVYIMYGNNDQIYDDRFKTTPDGTFQFTNLLKGSYTVYAYTKCTSCPGGQDTTVSQTIEIVENKSTIDVGDIIVYK